MSTTTVEPTPQLDEVRAQIREAVHPIVALIESLDANDPDRDAFVCEALGPLTMRARKELQEGPGDSAASREVVDEVYDAVTLMSAVVLAARHATNGEPAPEVYESDYGLGMDAMLAVAKIFKSRWLQEPTKEATLRMPPPGGRP